ncbi:MAG: hypothetical protein DRQ88_04560 [Epsilonproteobacteria bacterium]|nr:MAG: hypothetical protein DRQ89_07495 [Campylobacterota bacterium]RLA67028.1 MAG: hypothetical protein DRQ88_04560 [Campylobacterota bacterium]
MFRPLVFLFSFFICQNLFALPDTIEFWFISRAKYGHLQNYPYTLGKVSQVRGIYKGCKAWGEGCYDMEDSELVDRQSDLKINDYMIKREKRLKNTLDLFAPYNTHISDCDSEVGSSRFCGERLPARVDTNMEIWIDTSSSMNEIDPRGRDGNCMRNKFIRMVMESCGGNIPIMGIFNQSLREMGSFTDVCRNYGENNLNFLEDWIRSSKSKHLVVVTDYTQMKKKLKKFIDRTGSKVRGDFFKGATLENFLYWGKELSNSCQDLSLQD